MGFSKRRFLQSALGTLLAVGMVASAAPPAQAATWYTFARWCGTFFTLECSVQYTGGWPGGVARGVGPGNANQVRLQTRVGTSGDWITKTTTSNAVTASTAVGKNNWYRTCIQTIQGGGWQCLSPQGTIYLGD